MHGRACRARPSGEITKVTEHRNPDWSLIASTIGGWRVAYTDRQIKLIRNRLIDYYALQHWRADSA